MAANPTHSTAVRMTPEVDVVSLIQFLDLVRGQNLTGNHGTTFLRSFITWISIAGSLTTSLRADLPLSWMNQGQLSSGSSWRRLGALRTLPVLCTQVLLFSICPKGRWGAELADLGRYHLQMVADEWQSQDLNLGQLGSQTSSRFTVLIWWRDPKKGSASRWIILFEMYLNSYFYECRSFQSSFTGGTWLRLPSTISYGNLSSKLAPGTCKLVFKEGVLCKGYFPASEMVCRWYLSYNQYNTYYKVKIQL